MWEVIYVHFYNWDKSLNLAPIVYDLIELITEVSLWSKDYSTFDTHPQHTSLVQLILIPFVWLYMIKHDVCAQLQVDQTQKRFLIILYVFESDFRLSCFKFLFKMHFCIVLQKLVQRHFHKKLTTKSFPRKRG